MGTGPPLLQAAGPGVHPALARSPLGRPSPPAEGLSAANPSCCVHCRHPSVTSSSLIYAICFVGRPLDCLMARQPLLSTRDLQSCRTWSVGGWGRGTASRTLLSLLGLARAQGTAQHPSGPERAPTGTTWSEFPCASCLPHLVSAHPCWDFTDQVPAAAP